MAWIESRVHFNVCRADGTVGSADDAYQVASQVNEDALVGTFAELSKESWEGKMDRPFEALSQFELKDGVIDAASGRYEFILRLSDELFPPSLGGCSHLFGILAGDLLRFVLPPLKVRDFSVREISFPHGWRDQHVRSFRSTASSLHDIRKSFSIQAGMPLLAFSFKPRVGFKLDALEEVACDVISAGFNIVELDTRFLPIDAETLKRLKEIALRIADRTWGSHFGRLSLNFSLPTDILLGELEGFCSAMPSPVVVKIDGGFNGIDAIQAVRRSGIQNGQGSNPLITCYPLLRAALASYIPPDVFLDSLVMSGADIIYPGGRPDVGHMVRSLDGGSAISFAKAVTRYRSLVSANEAMPTIAGGIYAGQLHAYYELLGPNVGWFLGGGVALHRDGPKAGAELVVEIAKNAADLRAKAGRNWANNLPGRLADRCDAAYGGVSKLDKTELIYYSPREKMPSILSPI